MLRIEIQQEQEATNLTVEGKLTGPWVQELEKCWQAATSAETGRPVQVNLCAVSFIDFKGRELLARMRQHGVRFVAGGCLMKAVVEEIDAEVNQ